jgi:hypothetical protein
MTVRFFVDEPETEHPCPSCGETGTSTSLGGGFGGGASYHCSSPSQCPFPGLRTWLEAAGRPAPLDPVLKVEEVAVLQPLLAAVGAAVAKDPIDFKVVTEAARAFIAGVENTSRWPTAQPRRCRLDAAKAEAESLVRDADLQQVGDIRGLTHPQLKRATAKLGL